ncbi:unnamed protein product [Nezara viridula]|uniref:Transcription factor COE DNA-binding domain-containing protein n=1 Tax=Nezara viridula TaxID=85310 RepID=A0A9P0MRG0_NEZVI|nr:unnamed protein product [Nezara viridula]
MFLVMMNSLKMMNGYEAKRRVVNVQGRPLSDGPWRSSVFPRPVLTLPNLAPAIIYEGQDKNPEMCRVLLTHEVMCRLQIIDISDGSMLGTWFVFHRQYINLFGLGAVLYEISWYNSFRCLQSHRRVINSD